MSHQVYRIAAPYGARLFAVEALPPMPIPPGMPTVVLAHGWCLDHTSWHKVVDHVHRQRDARVVLYDQRGHGRSTMGEMDAPSVRILGEDLDEVIATAAPHGPLVLAGHSMGGMSIMAYAGQHHREFVERVRGTVLAATAASIEGRRPVPLEGIIMSVATRAPAIAPRVLVPMRVQRRLMFGPDPDPQDVRHAVHQIQHTKMPTIGRFFDAISHHDEIDALAVFVNVPTHIIAGSEDRLIPVSYAEALKGRIDSADFTVVPDCGHMLTYEAPEVVAEAIVRLIDGSREPLSAT